jgi:hypothetical protein
VLVAALLGVALPAAALCGGAAGAVVPTIEVDEVADELNLDGDCSFREAVETINTGVAADACAVPASPVVDLPVGHLLLDDPIVATTSLTIRGADSVITTIDCSGASGSCIQSTGAAAVLEVVDLGISSSHSALVSSGPTSAGVVVERVAAWSALAGVYSEAGAVEVVDSSIWESSYGIVQAGTADVVVERSVIGGSANAAISSFGGAVTVLSSTLHQNGGSGVDTGTAPIEVLTSTLADNGGNALRTVSGDVSVESSTIVGNLHAFDVIGSNATTFRNTVVADHTSDACVDPVDSAGYNVSDDDSCAFDHGRDRVGLDPELGPLDVSSAMPAYPLHPTSPLIDTGAGCAALDQLGRARPVDGDGDGTAHCDVGAVESSAAVVVPDPAEPDPLDPLDPGVQPARPATPVPGRPTFTG